jgi:hypothetical protein
MKSRLFRELEHKQNIGQTRRRQSAPELLAQARGDPQTQPGIGDVEVSGKFDVLRQDAEPNEIAGALEGHLDRQVLIGRRMLDAVGQQLVDAASGKD